MSDDPVVYPDGMKVWYSNNVISREHGPARILPDGTREWWTNGVRNRSDGGPARILPDGTWEWWVNGTLVRREQHEAKFAPCDHHAQAETLARITPEDSRARGMHPVSREALKRAMEWLNGLCLVPLNDGTVMIEGQVERGDFELVFDDEGPETLSVAAPARGGRVVTFDYRKGNR